MSDSPVTLHEMISHKAQLHEKKTRLEAELNEIKSAIQGVDDLIVEKMDNEGMTQVADDIMTVYISEMVVPSVTDWDAAWEYIFENKANHLLERRMAARAWREMEESGLHVPGTEPFTKRSLKRRTK